MSIINNNNLGLIHIYCGNGKGKTTASIGLVIRALGCNYKVLFMQFLKDNNSCEMNILKNLDNFTLLGGKKFDKFAFNMTDEEKEITKCYHHENFKKAIDMSNESNLLVLDEVLGAITSGTFDEDVLIDFLMNKPKNLEVVLTGRNPSEELIAMADYVSQIDKISHPYDRGIVARKGIEK